MQVSTRPMTIEEAKAAVKMYISTELGESCKRQDQRQKLMKVYGQAIEEEKVAIAQLDIDIALTRNRKAEAEGRKAEAEKRVAQGQQNLTSLQAQQSEIQASRQQNVAKIAEADQEIAKADFEKQQIARERRIILTRMFLSIFTKNSITEEESTRLFDTYLATGDLTNEKGPQGTYSRINSMEAVRRYLQNNPGVKTLDFRHFDQHVSDISTLAELLKKIPTITAIAFSNSISEATKAQIEEARNTRNDTLKVRYFA